MRIAKRFPAAVVLLLFAGGLRAQDLPRTATAQGALSYSTRKASNRCFDGASVAITMMSGSIALARLSRRCGSVISSITL